MRATESNTRERKREREADQGESRKSQRRAGNRSEGSENSAMRFGLSRRTVNNIQAREGEEGEGANGWQQRS
jgi:hypothetical protein